MLMRLGSCLKCKGDLMQEDDEWHCLQCGRYYYPITESLDQWEEPPKPVLAAVMGEGMPAKRKTRARRSPRHLNSRIVARDRSDNRWWERNRDVVKYLDQGLSVREISSLVSLGERQVRVIRERLHDLRTNNPEREALAAA